MSRGVALGPGLAAVAIIRCVGAPPGRGGIEAVAPRCICVDCMPEDTDWVACDVCRGIRVCPVCVDTVEMVVCASCKERQVTGLAPDRGRANYGMACASCVFPGWVCEACDY